MRQFSTPLAVNNPIAPEWRHLAFKWPADLPAPLPGQFFNFLPKMVESEAGIVLRRPIAFAGFDRASDGGLAHAIYQVRGPATRALSVMEPGDELDLIAPLGNCFPLPGEEQHALIAGGGIGLGPVLFLADTLEKLGRSWTLVLGFRSAERIPWNGHFKSAILPAWQHLMNLATITTDDGSHGLKGTVADALDLSPLLTRPVHLYACGPSAMLASLARLAVRWNLPAHFSAEQWMACGVGACHGCVLPASTGGYVRVCADGPVFDSRAITWEACL